MKKLLYTLPIVASSCMMEPAVTHPPFVPATEYAARLKLSQGMRDDNPKSQVIGEMDPKARIHFAADNLDKPVSNISPNEFSIDKPSYPGNDYTQPGADYNGPLSLGDPGVSASLWKESRGDNDLFHDFRAWQPMDLVTIVVTENSEAIKEADTKTKTSSTWEAAIAQLFGIETRSSSFNALNPSGMVKAESAAQFDGEGETTRRGRLKANISAMVVEVLPSGILRIEGQKIISVNNEEQIMVISGLIRPRDIMSDNTVDSAKIANVRIDYFGKGTLGEVQSPGWAARLLNKVWPF